MTLAARILACLASAGALAAPAAGELTGRVLGPGGEPVAGALVAVFGGTGDAALATTAGDGSFTVDGAPLAQAGAKILVHRADLGWTTSPLPPLRARLRIPASLTLAQAPLRRIAIKHADGTPAAGARVRPYPHGPEPVVSLDCLPAMSADEHGELGLRAAGGVLLSIEPAGGAAGARARIGDAAHLEIALLPDAVLRGCFTAPEGASAGGFTLLLTGALPEAPGVAPGSVQVTSSSDGTFALRCPSGSYYPSVFVPPGSDLRPLPIELGFGRDPIAVPGDVELAVPLDRFMGAYLQAGDAYVCSAVRGVSGPPHIRGLTQMMQCGSADVDYGEVVSIAGQVLDPQGAPASAWIRVSWEDGTNLETLSGPDGRFSLPGRQRAPLVFRAETRTAAIRMRRKASEAPILLCLSTSELVPIRARFHTRDGLPIAGARVSATQQTAGDGSHLDGFEGLAGTTDAQGFFASAPGAMLGDRVELRIERAGLPAQTCSIPALPAERKALEVPLD